MKNTWLVEIRTIILNLVCGQHHIIVKKKMSIVKCHDKLSIVKITLHSQNIVGNIITVLFVVHVSISVSNFSFVVEKNINKMIGRVQQAVEFTSKGNQAPSDQSLPIETKVNDQALLPSDEHALQTVEVESLPLLVVDDKKEKDRSILRTGAVGFDAVQKNIDKITTSAASNDKLEKGNKADKVDLNNETLLEQLDLTTSEQIDDSAVLSYVQNPIAAKNNDEVIRTVIDNMNDILKAAKHKKKQLKSEGLVECGIWDFAGQKEYYATHQTFCTPDAIYILVADINDDLKHDNNVEFDSIGGKFYQTMWRY